jgi:hypothetical protein
MSEGKKAIIVRLMRNASSQARVPLICQVHTVDQARRATDVGGDIVAPQGKRLDHPRAGFVGNDLVACFQG